MTKITRYPISSFTSFHGISLVVSSPKPKRDPLSSDKYSPHGGELSVQLSVLVSQSLIDEQSVLVSYSVPHQSQSALRNAAQSSIISLQRERTINRHVTISSLVTILENQCVQSIIY